MSNPNLTLTKICSICGLQKPLSAFVLKSGTLGASYGDICASCRKTKAEKKQTEKDDSSSIRTGAKIDYRTKNQMDLEYSEYQKRLQERDLEDKDKTEKEALNQSEKSDLLKKEEKKIKKNSQKGSWLSNLISGKPIQGILDTKKQAQHQAATDSKRIQEQSNQQSQQIVEEKKLEQQAKDEVRLNTIDFTMPLAPPTTQVKHQSSVFRTHQTLLGKVIHDKADQARKRLEKEKHAKENKTGKETESLVDYVKNTWGPKSRGR